MSAIYLEHPKHGVHVVYDEADVKKHEAIGWKRREEKKPEPPPRRGRPPKVSHG